MKRTFCFLLIIFVMNGLHSMALSINHEIRQDELLKHPGTVLKEAREALGESLRNGNSPHMIDALMQISTARLLIDTDSMPAVVTEIETIMNSCNNPVDRSVIALYLCDLYRMYVNRDYRIYSRTYIKGNRQMATWSIANYNDAIDSLCRVALEPVIPLQNTPLSRYKANITIAGYEGKKSWPLVKSFYPTMYDFVAEQVYNYYTTMEMPVQMLISDMLTFHKKTDAARFTWALKYILHEDDKPKRISYLDSLITTYKAHDYVIEAVVMRYHLQQQQEYSTKHDDFDKSSRYKMLKYWIDLYPRYYLTGCLRSECAALSQVNIQVELPSVSYPYEPVLAQIECENASILKCKLLKCNNLPLHGVDNLYVVESWKDVTQIHDTTIILSDDKSPNFQQKSHLYTLPLLSSGVYQLVLQASDETRTVSFVVAPYLLYGIELTDNEIMAVLVDNKSGLPVDNQNINLYTYKNERVGQAATNADGICTFKNCDKSKRYRIALDNITYSPFAIRVDLNDRNYNNRNTNSQIFTDRSIYRPGQTLQYSALVYEIDKEKRTVVSQEKVNLLLRDAARNVVWRDTLTTDNYGSVHGSVSLPVEAHQGYWELCVENKDYSSSRRIMVAEYKRPQFRVVCDAIKGTYEYGTGINVTGRSESFAGVPIAFAPVRYTIRRGSLYGNYQDILVTDSTTTNADGEFRFDFKTEPPIDNLWRKWGTRYVVEVVVTSSTGESQRDEMVVYVSGTSIHIRMNIPEKVNSREAAPFNITLHNSQGELIERPIDIALYCLNDTAIGVSLDKRSRKATPLWKDVSASGRSTIVLPYRQLQSGGYRIVASTTDYDGEVVADSTSFVLYTPHEKCPPISWALWCPVEKQSVVDGETIKFDVGSSYKNASLLYIVKEGNHIVDISRRKLDNSMISIEIPYKSEYEDVVLIQVLLVRDNEIHRQQLIAYRHQPDPKLTITPVTFRDKTQTGSKERWQFTVRDANGNPVDALFMAELYDASLDMLHPHSWYFSPHYTPLIPYVGISQYWNYCGKERVSLNYMTEYHDAECYTSIYPVLYTYSGIAPLIQETAVLKSYARAAESNVAMAKMTSTVGGGYGEDTLAEALEEESADTANTPPEQSDIAIEYRTNLDETAFFYPHLVTNSEGNVMVEFTMPESNTTWNFFSLAVTSALQSGMYNAGVVSSKPLMVSPNMPRFVRQGDQLVLAMAIQNTTEELLQGNALLELYHPETNEEITSVKKPFVVNQKGTVTVRFTVDIPDTLSIVGIRLGAATELYSDGEQHLLAVLPAMTFVTESQPFYLSPNVRDTTITFASMQKNVDKATLQNYRLVLEYCDNPAWYAITALPSLVEPANNSATSLMASLYANVVACAVIEQNKMVVDAIEHWQQTSHSKALVSPLTDNETLKQILLSQTPWILDAKNNTEQLQQIANLLNKKRAEQQVNNIVDELYKLQTESGAWSWFKDMYPSFYITLDIMSGLSRIAHWDNTSEQIRKMIIKALNYLDAEYVHRNEKDTSLRYEDLYYLYVRSAYQDIPITDTVLAIHRKQLKTLTTTWHQLDDIEKAYAAIVLYKYGYQKQAHEIVESLRQYATITAEQGMFWANNRSDNFYRYNAIRVHCAIYEAFEMIDSNVVELDAMRQWLLLQKQAQSWENVPSTLDAINILLTSGSNWISNKTEVATIKWGSTQLPEAVQADKIMGYEKYVRIGDEIDKTDATLIVEKHSDHPSWGAIYWQYYDKITEVKEQGNHQISLNRTFSVERNGAWVDASHNLLDVGDKILIRIEFYIDRDMQFMTLSDMRPACFEPIEQLPKYTYGDGLYYYQVPSDAGTNFYFDYIPRGTHVIEYEVYVDRRGSYQCGISTLQSMYAPQYIAHSAGVVFEVENNVDGNR